jgi:hypothetical protein
MRLHLLAAVAALAIAMPAPAAVVFEWHQVAAINSGPATNAPVTALALNPGDTVFLQLMMRDTNPAGDTFAWAFGDGVIPPPTSNFNGVGLFGIGTGIRTTPGVFQITGNTVSDRRLVSIPDAELPPPNQGLGNQPYGTSVFSLLAGNAGMDFSAISNLADGNPFENGDFPRVRAPSTSFLMPFFNMRFTYLGGSGTLNLVDAATGPTNEQNQVGGAGGVTLATLDTQLFSTAPVVNITPVPEPSSMALAGIAVAGLWKLRRRKTVAA